MREVNANRRPDFAHIAGQIRRGARVLDLGCEDGVLLEHLRDKRDAHGIGVDMNAEQLTRCIKRGLQVVHTDIRDGLPLFASDSFDYVILSQTLQSIDRPPQTVVREMLRVGRAGVVSFPNFGYWRFRRQLLFGRMPVGGNLPYQWHDTPHVRYCTVEDFEQWCAAQKLNVRARVFLNGGGRLVHFAPNVMAATAIYQLTAD